MEPLRKDLAPIKMRNYGRILQDVVTYICDLEDGPTRRSLIVYVAQCMRQKNMVWNKDQESGLDRIKADIAKISDGKLTCDFSGFEEAFNGGLKKPENQPVKQDKKVKNKNKKVVKNNQ